jgi:hypothetical protein
LPFTGTFVNLGVNHVDMSKFTDSPRVFVSTNPWKITATFSTVSSTRDEYIAVIEDLKASAPGELKKGEKRSKLDQGHIALINTLESRIEAIDTELAVSLSWNARSLVVKACPAASSPETLDTIFAPYQTP